MKSVDSLETVSVANAPGGSFSTPPSVSTVLYLTSNSDGFTIGGTTQYALVPGGEAQASDYYTFVSYSDSANQEVFTRQYDVPTGAVTLTLPNAWSPTPPTPATFPTFTFDYTGLSSQAAVADQASVSWTQSSQAYAVNVVATANYQSGSTSLTIPDLTSLTGFLSMAPSATSVRWVATSWGGTVQLFTGSIPQTISYASGFGNYTQP